MPKTKINIRRLKELACIAQALNLEVEDE